MHRSVNIGSPPPGLSNSSSLVSQGVSAHFGKDALSLDILTRVNTSSKDTVGYSMYSEWSSLQQTIQAEVSDLSVLNKFPSSAGKDVATSIVKQLAQNLGITNTSHCEPSRLEEDKDVLWCMEVLSYGLSLPLSEHDTIRDSVNVYCEWLMALLKPKICVPKSICEEPNLYARIMIKHFYNLFVPRAESNADTINRQAVLCHRVLRMLQKIARESKILVRETWESMLMFLLAINDTLLAPPTVKDDIGDQLCERIVSVLFEIWLLACVSCFPSPSLWKTFRDMCLYWRHRAALIDQWNRVNVALTSKLLRFMYGPSCPELKFGEEDAHLIPSDMSNDCIAQTWFRFLHLLGNPVELCYPTVISNTPKFLHYALTSEHVVDPCQHECLIILPQIFLKAMRGISVLVDSFLGIACHPGDEFHWDSTKVMATTSVHSVTPPQQRKPVKSFSVATSSSKGLPKASLISLTSAKSIGSSGSQQSSIGSSPTPTSVQQPHPFPSLASGLVDARLRLAQTRPKCNSILHLFGAWLFEAALIGVRFSVVNKDGEKSKRPGSLVLETRRGSGPPFSETSDIPPELTLQHYESGRAEAIGALCRIFCAKKTGEDILPVYLARFYLAIHQGLKASELQAGEQVLCGILLNSCDLLRLDLDGVMVLVPDFIDALDKVLNERELQFRYCIVGTEKDSPKVREKIQTLPDHWSSANFNVPHTELRRATIHLLLSMLALPLHFRSLVIKDVLGGADKPHLTFQSLRPRLFGLLLSALQSETDSINTQMLLGGVLFSIQDMAMSEEEGQVLQEDGMSESSSGFLTSANISDIFSSHSGASSTVPSLDDSDFSSNPTPANIHPDSLYALFVRTTYLVCQRLISTWKSDLNVSLAALEMLSGFAKIKMPEHESKEIKLPVTWVCDYIVHQCSRPPPFHSKDLHSTIVAAFHCLTTWLLEHPYLLQDPDCLNTVMEVVELGISGTKSQTKPTELPRMKGEKENKPASMRVRDAAESVLTYILEHVGYFPSLSGQASTSSLLDEESLLCYCNSWNGNRSITREDAVKHFKYYVVDNSTIVALMEQPLGNDQDPQPTVTVLIRGPFGRNAWTMQLRHLPRHKSGTKMFPVNPGRPVPMTEHHVKQTAGPRYYPDSVNRIQQCKAERSIPPLDSLITAKVAQDHEKLARFVDQQVSFEESVSKRTRSQKTEYPNPETECRAPPVCQEFETARLFLSHFGFLSLEALKETVESGSPSLMALNSIQPGFAADIQALDGMSNRTCDTAFVFYVKSGQKVAHDILRNVNSRHNVHPYFLEFLLSLGWPVDVAKHPGWTGHVSTSWKVTDPVPEGENAHMASAPGCDPFEGDHAQQSAPIISRNCGTATAVKQESLFAQRRNSADRNAAHRDHGGSLYNGQSQVLYWSDAMAEIAFVVPSARQLTADDLAADLSDVEVDSPVRGDRFDRGTLERQTMPHGQAHGCVGSQFEMCKPRTLSLDLDKAPLKDKESPNDPKARKIGRHPNAAGFDTKVFIVWLQRYEDHHNFPIADLLLETQVGLESNTYHPRTQEKDVIVIFIHALQNGLFRIDMQGQTGKISMAIPLVDGVVVSRRVLGTLVRQTALNMCLRRRLENDSHYPPHLRRKLKIQELVHKYRQPMSEPEFYASFFNESTPS